MSASQFYMHMKILHVEDEPTIVDLVGRMLDATAPYASVVVTAAASLEAAINHLLSTHFDVVLLDLALPDSVGPATFHEVYQRTDSPIIGLTGESSLEARCQLVADGAQDCIYKPEMTPDTLLRSIRFAIERHRTLNELRHTLKELQASNQTLQELLEKVGEV